MTEPAGDTGQPEADTPGVGPDAADPASRWRGLMAQGRGAVSVGRSRADRLMERYRDRPIADLGLRIYQRDREAAGTIVSSAVAFRLFLFFVPLLLLLVGLLGFLPQTIDQGDVADAGITGSLAEQIDAALSQPNTTRWIAVGIGLLGMITAGRALSKTLTSASCLAWRLPVRSKASMKVTGALVGLISGVALVAVAISRVRSDLGLAFAGMSFVVALAVYAAAWLLVMLMLPRASTDPSVLLPGAAFLSVVLVGMQSVSQLYLPNKINRASELYGAVGTTVVVLGWFFILGRAIILAMVVNAVLFERFGSISEFVFSLPGLRVLPRRSARLRRFFALEESSLGGPDAEPHRQAGAARDDGRQDDREGP